MKAAYIEAHGGPEVLAYGDLPDPEVGPNDVLVRVQASALNRLDVYTRAGVRGTRREFPPPLVLGGDAAGDLEAVGDHVRELKVGDRVVVNPKVTCGQCQRCLGGEDDLCPASRMIGTAMDGSYAQYLRAPASNVHVFSDQVSYEEAASVPTTFLPMWSMLVRRAELKPWESVLVLSASSGVGSAAIQVAKKVIGAHVIATTSSAEKASKARELGADEVIDYTTEDIVPRVKEITSGQGVDVVVDHLGTEFFEAAFNSLRPGGRYGNCGVTTGYKADLHLGAFFTRQLKMYGVFMGSKADMDQIVQMLDRGKIEPAIHRVFPLDRAAEAHRVMDELNFFGKLVLNP
ncbi:MAG: zinc-binding dehydrogenase [Dehalococcoidia bacterium]|nr:zinc-binding dehydrogenase [Dehalococcoidia bacterium]